MFRRRRNERGVSLLDTVIGVALFALVFIGVASAFELSVRIVTNNKARAGAIALADQQMEYIRSLSYNAVGTVGGIPAGNLPESQSLSLNGIHYTRRTVVEYGNDGVDGTNQDYKAVKVQVSWINQGTTYDVILDSRASPLQIGAITGGTLVINSVNSLGVALPGAEVTIINPSTSPAINTSTYTDASGTLTVLGVPAASGYEIAVTSPGYSTAQTYSVTAQNTHPSPGNLTVSNNQTTSGTFAIDILGTKTINTWTQILNGTSSDPLSNAADIATSSDITISGGAAKLSSGALNGVVQSTAFTPTSLATWGKFSWSDSQPASTSIRYHVYTGDGTTLIPDSYVPGNAAGFVSGTVSLASVPTSTYPTLTLEAVFSSKATTTSPSLTSWSITDTYGPLPIANVAFTLQGAKTIGSGPSGTIYKYSTSQNTGSTGSITIPNLEWDNYTVSIPASTGYDVASACNPQPESLSPGATMTSNFYLAAHTTNSLLVDVHAGSSGALIQGATVALSYRTFAATSTTDSCGQSFFPGLSSTGNYSISVSAAGHTTYNSSSAAVSGTSRFSVVLN